MDYIQKLKHCAYERGVGNLQHRTIAEFAWFVNSVIWDGTDEFKAKYAFDWHASNALETWIEKFCEYHAEQVLIYNQNEEDELKEILERKL